MSFSSPVRSETGVPARRAALQLLDAVLRRGQPLERALSGATKGLGNPADRALAHAIASETLRRLPDLDDLIDGATKQRLPDDAKARMVLRMALVQALILGTPQHAAVATALGLMEGGPKRLVHGVLGTLLRQSAKLRSIPMLLPAVESRWEQHWGSAMVAAAATALAEPPLIDLTIKDVSETARWAEVLGGESLAPGHVRLPRGVSITELPGFEEGAWWVQNIAASVPARLLGTGDGRKVLDLCAAPGGKTMQLAAAGWNVTAVEREASRIERLQQNLDRTGLTATIIEGDVMKWAPAAPVDAILIDAPCSATGIFARHPDVLHRVRPRDIVDLSDLQARMIKRAADWLTPGGTLIYASCSLEPEEGEHIVEGIVGAGLSVKPVTDQELPAGLKAHKRGWVRVLPGDNCDGFFIARMIRDEGQDLLNTRS
jgi:16S rRNA (cytosine967-C5)-methyltransferase